MLEARGGPGRPIPTKVPYRPDGPKALSNRPSTWTTFETACAALEGPNPHGFDGVGFMFWHPPHTEAAYFVGIDLDKCRNPKTGVIEPWARAILDRLNSYAEVSPSGAGVHVIVKGRLPENGGRRDNVECYTLGRYFTATGQWLDEWPDEIVEDQEASVSRGFRTSTRPRSSCSGLRQGRVGRAGIPCRARSRSRPSVPWRVPNGAASLGAGAQGAAARGRVRGPAGPPGRGPAAPERLARARGRGLAGRRAPPVGRAQALPSQPPKGRDSAPAGAWRAASARWRGSW
jgi:hypothetical protein